MTSIGHNDMENDMSGVDILEVSGVLELMDSYCPILNDNTSSNNPMDARIGGWFKPRHIELNQLCLRTDAPEELVTLS